MKFILFTFYRVGSSRIRMQILILLAAKLIAMFSGVSTTF